MRTLVPLLALIPLLSACSSHDGDTNQSSSQNNSNVTMTGPHSGNLSDGAALTGGDFARNENALRFIDYMVDKHHYDRSQLEYWISHAKRLDSVISLMDRQAPTPSSRPSGPTGAWLRYRKQFITPDNIKNGVAFWQQHAATLDRAYQLYGVPPEIIVGIIGVETRWGRVLGKTRLLDALSTLSFDYPRRSEYFSRELETFLLMARDEHVDAHELRGSFAGAMGYCQFMPSSYKSFAVDFNHDGHINLWDPEDAIGSVAHYFQANGWTPGDAIAIRGNGQALGLKYGFENRYPVQALTAAGLKPTKSLGTHTEASVLRLDVGTNYEYWYGLSNFYTITRYNKSVHYSMAVWQLGDAVKHAVEESNTSTRVASNY
ncbi:MAG: lytic murein transglycosylase B [Tolumonas sp.]|nr:lytic murein transglycosylase B [Tolumonas sp.]